MMIQTVCVTEDSVQQQSKLIQKGSFNGSLVDSIQAPPLFREEYGNFEIMLIVQSMAFVNKFICNFYNINGVFQSIYT